MILKKIYRTGKPLKSTSEIPDSISDSNVMKSCGSHLGRGDSIPEMHPELDTHIQVPQLVWGCAGERRAPRTFQFVSEPAAVIDEPCLGDDPSLQMFVGTSTLIIRSPS